jgi:hypothetical protein
MARQREGAQHERDGSQQGGTGQSGCGHGRFRLRFSGVETG